MTYRFSLRSIRAGAVAAVSAVVLVGCNGGTEVEDPPTTASPSAPTSSPESSPSPTETESTEEPTTEGPTDEPTEASALPELPEAAKENTPEGAEAFIRYYFDVANFALTKPEPGLVPKIASDECVSCATLEAQVADLSQQGQRATSNPYEIKSMALVGGTTQDVELFNMVVALPATTIESRDGTVSDPSQEAEYSGTGGARWEGGRWELLDLDLSP